MNSIFNYYINIVLSYLPLWLKRLFYYGHTQYCSVCGNTLRCFRPFGRPTRYNAWCPLCGSLERHRFAWHVLVKKTDLLTGGPRSLLHVAPEKMIERRLRSIPDIVYLSGDLTNPQAMIKMDLLDIPKPDASFDVFYCSHVLEHIPNDKAAMKELYRVLKPGGWGIIQVPIDGQTTREDITIQDPQERCRLFGQEDHFRIYGTDLNERLKEQGFQTEIVNVNKVIATEKQKRYGLQSSETLFLCRKEFSVNRKQ